MEVLKLAAAAAQGFTNLQCRECANSIRKALMQAGQNGDEVEIRGAAGRDFMICLSL
jgi:hypothetical protein